MSYPNPYAIAANSGDVPSRAAVIAYLVSLKTYLDTPAFASIQAPVAFKNAVGATQFAVASTVLAVNYLTASGSGAGNGVNLVATGSDGNISVNIATKGGGQFNFGSVANGTQFVIASTALSVNYLQVTGAGAGNGATLSSEGASLAVSINYLAKGAANHNFHTNGLIQFLVANTVSAVNYLAVTGSATLNAVTIASDGTDAAVPIQVVPKGAGNTFFKNAIAITDGITAPATAAGFGLLYIDSADGDLKIKFGDGTVKTIVVDT